MLRRNLGRLRIARVVTVLALALLASAGIAFAGQNPTIVVSTVDELYSAVNDPANAGVAVVLTPGRYVLSASRPNGGRLELQTDMSLIGAGGETGVANGNSTVFEAFGSEFVDNTAQIAGIDPGGVRVAGGLSTTLANATSDNTVSVSLTGSKVSGNQVVDFDAFGAIETALSGIAGTNNHVTIALRGVSTQVDVVTVDSAPPDPSGTNTITVVRIPQSTP